MTNEKLEAQKRMKALMQIARLCEEAAAVLAEVNEGPCAQGKLVWIEQKARVQVNLWA
jgi:hypothetical protein